MTDHLGNVTVQLSDVKAGNLAAASIKAKVLSYQQYFPFGWGMPGRSLNADRMRFSYNGMEDSPEISSGHQSTFYRELDTRSIRWWSIDPMTNPNEAPYVLNQNNPAINADPNGNCPWCPIPIIIGFLLAPEVLQSPSNNPSSDAKGISDAQYMSNLAKGGAAILPVVIIEAGVVAIGKEVLTEAADQATGGVLGWVTMLNPKNWFKKKPKIEVKQTTKNEYQGGEFLDDFSQQKFLKHQTLLKEQKELKKIIDKYDKDITEANEAVTKAEKIYKRKNDAYFEAVISDKYTARDRSVLKSASDKAEAELKTKTSELEDLKSAREAWEPLEKHLENEIKDIDK